MEIRTVAIVGGAGQMGAGMALVVALGGMACTIIDRSEDAVQAARERISKSLDRAVASGKLTGEESSAALERIHTTSDLRAGVLEADLVIETVYEELDLKLAVLEELDQICRDDAIIASNTGQFAISRLAAATGRPDRVIGTHWFNPPTRMRLIEVIRGVETSDDTLAATLDFAKRCGKETIVCKRDTQGFVTTRLIMLLIMEATRIVEEGIADVDDVNRACVLAFNHAMGPLDTVDLSGLDSTQTAGDAMAFHLGERFRPPQLMRSLVNAGHYGRKSGRGFSEYPDASSPK